MRARVSSPTSPPVAGSAGIRGTDGRAHVRRRVCRHGSNDDTNNKSSQPELRGSARVSSWSDGSRMGWEGGAGVSGRRDGPLAIWGGGGVSTARRRRRSSLARYGEAAMGGGGENPMVSLAWEVWGRRRGASAGDETAAAAGLSGGGEHGQRRRCLGD